MTRTAWWVIGLATLVLFGASTIGLLAILGASGTRIFVTNEGPIRLAHLVVHANGKALPIGPLSPGETKSVLARPGDASDVSLEFTTMDGVGHIRETGRSVGPWVKSGRIDLTIRDLSVVNQAPVPGSGETDSPQRQAQ
ncbi:MAG: hypothetical protein U0800_18210 [Isosphaeraceae bacterium]